MEPTTLSLAAGSLAASARVLADAEPLAETTARAGELVCRALRDGGRVLACGNGGSAADAQHLVAELVGRFESDRPGLPAIALASDVAVLTALANDFGVEQTFARQVQALGRSGDVLVALSTSGRSPNVLTAAKAARDAGMAVVALTGSAGGALAGLADIALQAPSDVTARIQEVHGALIHALCAIVDAAMHP
jgi:D-sedoheptulose 7-phosphate isomerase